MPVSRNVQSDGHALELCGGRTWGTDATEIDGDADCGAAAEGNGFARGSGTSRPIARTQVVSDNATTIDICSAMFHIKRKSPTASSRSHNE
jgi:hypothetical protein